NGDQGLARRLSQFNPEFGVNLIGGLQQTMIRRIASIVPTLLVCAGLQAATTNTTLNVTTTGAIGATGITASGTAALSGIRHGTLSGTLPITPDSSQNLNGTFTITLTSGTTGTLTGTLKIPASALTGTLTGSATITGGTGNFVGATGSFPNLTGSL